MSSSQACAIASEEPWARASVSARSAFARSAASAPPPSVSASAMPSAPARFVSTRLLPLGAVVPLGRFEEEVLDQVEEAVAVLGAALVAEVAHRVEHAAALGRHGPLAGALDLAAAAAAGARRRAVLGRRRAAGAEG